MSDSNLLRRLIIYDNLLHVGALRGVQRRGVLCLGRPWLEELYRHREGEEGTGGQPNGHIRKALQQQPGGLNH